jgi:hypothetical protein
MVAPELPTGIPIGLAVFDHDADRQGHHPMRVVSAGRRHIVQVDTEVLAAGLAIVLGVRDVQLTRSPGPQVPEIVQGAGEEMVSGCRLAAARAGALRLNALFFDDFRLRQVFDAGKGDIRDILAGTNFE